MITNAEDRTNKLDMLLMNIRYKGHYVHEVSNSNILLLDDPETIWIVYTGTVNLFIVPLNNGTVSGTRQFLFQCPSAMLLFGMDIQGFGYSLEIVGMPTAQLVRLPRQRFTELCQDAIYAELMTELINEWVVTLTKSLFQEALPRQIEPLNEVGKKQLTERQVVHIKDGLKWATCDHNEDVSTTENIAFNDRTDLPLISKLSYLPLTPSTWLRALAPVSVELRSTQSLIRHPDGADFWLALSEFHRLILSTIQVVKEKKDTAQRELLHKRQTMNRQHFADALEKLASPLGRAGLSVIAPSESSNALVAACQAVAQAIGIDLKMLPDADDSHPITLQRIASFSRLRTRKVALRGEWWQENNGPLLAYLNLNNEHTPVALLLSGNNGNKRYLLYNPLTRTKVPVTPEIAATLHGMAYEFHRTFPNRVLTATDLVRFSTQGLRRELATMVAFSMIVGLLALLFPLASGYIVDQVIPGALRTSLLVMLFALICAALGSTGFEILRGISLLQLETRIDLSLQTALLDRLLELPSRFFRQYSSGDLVLRLMSVSSIRQALSGVVLTTLLSSAFSVFSLLLLFFYSIPLAIIALVLAGIWLITILMLTRKQVQQERKLATQQGLISGMLLGFLHGIAKFRVANAETRVFGQWATEYTKLRLIAYRSRLWGNFLTVFSAVFPVIMLIVLFSAVAHLTTFGFTTGSFVAFNAAFAQFVASTLALSTAYATAMRTLPIYERARPILEAVPEVDETKAGPGKLKGQIEVEQLSFRYSDTTPYVLQDISVSISRGEFVAFVGPSGSGKSTMLRLLMGFETPTAGNIYFDGQDLAAVDVRLVRQQIGVVLQNGRLLEGDIFSNIMGASTVSMDEVWEASRMAGIADDISEMPMGMHTIVSGGGTTLSGGQRQRLLIARALVNKPRILFFDEATSALDNRTQEIVSKSITQLNATKVVIAHRLNTILKADQIYVFDNGKIVQQGNYRSLIKEPGLFSQLARRQML